MFCLTGQIFLGRFLPKIKLNQSGHCVADVCHSPRATARLSNSDSERKFFVFTATIDRTERGLDMLNPWFGWFHSFLLTGGVFGLSLAVTYTYKSVLARVSQRRHTLHRICNRVKLDSLWQHRAQRRKKGIDTYPELIKTKEHVSVLFHTTTYPFLFKL